jgi:hypothetical protein
VGDVHDPDSYAHHRSGEPEQQFDGSADRALLRTEAPHRQRCEPGDEQYPYCLPCQRTGQSDDRGQR